MLLGIKGAGKGVQRAGKIVLPHHLINFEIQRHYQNEGKFKVVYIQNN